MNRKVVTAALALFVIVNIYFLSQSSLFQPRREGSNSPHPGAPTADSTPTTRVKKPHDKNITGRK